MSPTILEYLFWKGINKIKIKIMGQVIGVIILFVGIILFIGNVSGWWPTFSYAGFITMAFGTLVLRISNDD